MESRIGRGDRRAAQAPWRLLRLGRERFTLDEGLSRAVAKVFVQLYAEGLIYKDKRLVNWDPKFQTAISDLEVVPVESKGAFKWSRDEGSPLDAAGLTKTLAKNPNGHLYYFDYPVVDDAGEETGQVITVATTRPETMLGDTAVAVHPDDDRYAALVGRKVRLPLVGRLIAIVADAYSDPEKGTGAVKITPAHDFNDFEVGRRHESEGARAINVLDSAGKVSLNGNLAFFEGIESDNDHARLLAAIDGQDRFVARARIVELMALAGLLRKIEPHAHQVPHGDRSNAVIEPWLTDQWYVDAKTLAQPALEAVRDGRTQLVPKTWEKTYYDWLENIQPWCVSRQLWWGHQIPAWYSPWGGIYVEETEDAAFAAALADGVTRGALTDAEAMALAEDPAQLADTIRRDEDVLDTWFSSALWPFSTLGWPDDTTELKRYYPTDVLVTGFDIIFFWVARMMMMGLHFREEIPFRDVYIHALVRDEKGAKMSKSKGNVIDPIDLIDRYGADALRFTLAAMAVQGRDLKLSENRVEGYRNFATKLWNASRFAEMNACVRVVGFDPVGVKETLNQWILGEADRAATETAGAIEAYRFNDAAMAVYRFVWSVFCDWHLELAKPLLQAEGDFAAKAETQATIAHVLDLTYAMLHPFMPFLTEELWRIKGEFGPARAGPLALGPWPREGVALDAEVENEIGWVVDLISEVRSVKSEMGVSPSTQTPLVLVQPSEAAKRSAEAWGESIKRLARASAIETSPVAPEASVLLIVRGETIAMPLAGIVDLAAERARLDKEIDKVRLEVAKVAAKLGNDDFRARAPEDVIAEHEERREAFEQRLGKLGVARHRLEKI